MTHRLDRRWPLLFIPIIIVKDGTSYIGSGTGSLAGAIYCLSLESEYGKSVRMGGSSV